MRNKTLAAVLALLFSLLGLHRFYLGQWLRGAIYILAVPVVTVVVATIVGFPLEESYNEFSIGILNKLLFAPWPAYIPLAAIGVFDCIWFLAMSQERFDARYNQPGSVSAKSVGVNAMVFVVSIALAYVIYQQFFKAKTIDVAGTTAAYSLSAQELAEEFSEDEVAALAKYDLKVIEVTGEVMDEEMELLGGESARVLLLEGNGTAYVKCKFAPSEMEQVAEVAIGEEITVKGYVRDFLVGEVVLEDCLLQE